MAGRALPLLAEAEVAGGNGGSRDPGPKTPLPSAIGGTAGAGPGSSSSSPTMSESTSGGTGGGQSKRPCCQFFGDNHLDKQMMQWTKVLSIT